MKKILLIPLMMLTMMPMAACDGSNADPILPEQPG
jgi:predicted small secreted protein